MASTAGEREASPDDRPRIPGAVVRRAGRAAAGPWIGVTGHRGLPAAEAARIRASVRRALTAVAGPGTVLASPLAEGADRLAAEEALALGLALFAPLPFARAEYERDFAKPGSLAAFRALLARAGGVEELRGLRTDEGAAYEAVGRRVLALSDGLVAVWDGLPPRGRGGTAQVVAEARGAGVPVLWIPLEGADDPAAAQEWAEAVRARHGRRGPPALG